MLEKCKFYSIRRNYLGHSFIFIRREDPKQCWEGIKVIISHSDCSVQGLEDVMLLDSCSAWNTTSGMLVTQDDTRQFSGAMCSRNWARLSICQEYYLYYCTNLNCYNCSEPWSFILINDSVINRKYTSTKASEFTWNENVENSWILPPLPLFPGGTENCSEVSAVVSVLEMSYQNP